MHLLSLLCYSLFALNVNGQANTQNNTTKLHAAMSQSIYTTTSPVTAMDSSTVDLAAQAQITAASDTMTKAAAASAKVSGPVMVSGGKTGATTNAGTNATISTVSVPSSTSPKSAASGFAASVQVPLAAGGAVGMLGLLAAL